MRLLRQGICLFLLLAFPTWLAAQAAAAKKAPARAPVKTADELREECKKFVQEFFDWYLPKASADVSKQGPADALALKKHPEDFSRELTYALATDAAARAKSNEVVGLDGDPFLNCQDCPLHVQYGEPKLNGYRCQVALYFVQDGVAEAEPHVIPEAAYLPGKKWIFVNFLDGDGQGDLLKTLKELKAEREKAK